MTNLKKLSEAHVNGLKSSIHALEVQVTILKTLLSDDGEVEETSEHDIGEMKKKLKKDKAENSADDKDDDDNDDDFGPKKTKGGKKASKFEDDDDNDKEDDDDNDKEDDDDNDKEDDDDDAPPKKGKKAKKLSIKDVNAACKERCERTSFEDTVSLLKKKFGVKSVSLLKPEQYADVIKVMSK